MKLPSASTVSAFLFGTGKKHCEVHEKLDEAIEKLTTQQAVTTEIVENHTKRLDIGSEDFKKIRESIAGINTSLAVLAEKASQRRNEYDKG